MQGPFRADAVFANEIERLFGKRVAQFFGGVQPCGGHDPIERYAGRGNHVLGGPRHFRADAVAGNQDHVHVNGEL